MSRVAPLTPVPALPDCAVAPQEAESNSVRPYGGQLPDARRADRRQRLLDAALELYGTVGFHQTTVAELCRQARVAPRQFYEEFASQDAVLLELSQNLSALQEAAMVTAVMGAGLDMEARARAGISAYCHALVDDERRARVLCVEVVAVPGVVRHAHTVTISRFGDFLRAEFDGLGRELNEPIMDTVELSTLATALTGGVHEALMQWLFADERPDLERLIDTLTALYVAVGSWLTLPVRPV